MSEIENDIFCPVCSCFPCQCKPRRLACGHPLVCISAEYKPDTNRPTKACGWCASLAAEREKWKPLADMVHDHLTIYGECLVCRAKYDPYNGTFEHEDDCGYDIAIREADDD